jgi:hypothetical protein
VPTGDIPDRFVEPAVEVRPVKYRFASGNPITAVNRMAAAAR